LPPRRQPKEHKEHRAPLQLPPDETARVIDEDTYDQTLEALVNALDVRDRLSEGHSARVAEYALDIGRHVGLQPRTQAWQDLKRAALLHDVGEIGVSDFILHKPGPLTPEEWNELKRHSAIGYEMLRPIEGLAGAANIIYSHHERFDGKGYPRGLAGDEIPLGARILTVADTFEAMTSDRPYRRALLWDAAKQEIVRNSGTQFDPRVVDAFLECCEGWFREPHRLGTRVSPGDRRREMAWLTANRRDLEIRHPGQWIAVHGDQIVAMDKDLATVIRKAEAKGVEDALIVATRFKDCQAAIQVAQWL
jgi:response regulator RpfG family c-di-GMP phosphodiesterase